MLYAIVPKASKGIIFHLPLNSSTRANSGNSKLPSDLTKGKKEINIVEN